MSIDERLEAYQRAFNQVDDLMEYRGMTKEQFAEIASALNLRLKSAKIYEQPVGLPSNEVVKKVAAALYQYHGACEFDWKTLKRDMPDYYKDFIGQAKAALAAMAPKREISDLQSEIARGSFKSVMESDARIAEIRANMAHEAATAQQNGWFLPAARINDLQQASVAHTIKRCKQAHFVDVRIRINSEYEYEEADWIQHLIPTGERI